MWVPALHSATLELGRTLFPAILYLTVPAFLLVYFSVRKRAEPKVGELLFYFLDLRSSHSVSLPASTFSWRCSPRRWWAGGSPARVGIPDGRGCVLVAMVVGLGWMAEFARSVQEPERWGRINVYYKELDELASWLQQHVAPDTVLANFGASAYIAAYGKCAMLLHPKFEDEGIRDRVLDVWGSSCSKVRKLSLSRLGG